jgi:hypothetical protein
MTVRIDRFTRHLEENEADGARRAAKSRRRLRLRPPQRRAPVYAKSVFEGTGRAGWARAAGARMRSVDGRPAGPRVMRDQGTVRREAKGDPCSGSPFSILDSQFWLFRHLRGWPRALTPRFGAAHGADAPPSERAPQSGNRPHVAPVSGSRCPACATRACATATRGAGEKGITGRAVRSSRRSTGRAASARRVTGASHRVKTSGGGAPSAAPALGCQRHRNSWPRPPGPMPWGRGHTHGGPPRGVSSREAEATNLPRTEARAVARLALVAIARGLPPTDMFDEPQFSIPDASSPMPGSLGAGIGTSL